MHIPDNYLSPQTDAVMAVAMVPVWVHCIKKVRATLDREHMAFLGICAAFSFLLMMFNVPLPGGTTGHAVGGALIALLLGPEAAAIAVSVALALQALLFGDGGILSFGANCFNMAFVLPFVAAMVFRALNSRLHDKSWGTSVSAIVSGWVVRGCPLRCHRVWHSADALHQRLGCSAVLPLPAVCFHSCHDDSAYAGCRCRRGRGDGRHLRFH